MGLPICRVISSATFSFMERKASRKGRQISTRRSTGTSRQACWARRMRCRIEASSDSGVGSIVR
jgi:hypothetical protein